MLSNSLSDARNALKRVDPGTGRIQSALVAGVLEVRIDHPQRAGAISPGMMLDLLDITMRLEPAAGTVVLLHSSADRAFCAGGDLGSVRAHLLDASMAKAMVITMTRALDALSERAAFVLAAVEGPALGGGAEILTACDTVVMGENGRVGFVHAGLGVSPGWGGARRLRQRVGPRLAAQWLVDPSARDAAESYRLGMADVVVPSGTALEEARIRAQRVQRVPTPARLAASRLATGDQTDEMEQFLDLWGGPDHRAALEKTTAGR